MNESPNPRSTLLRKVTIGLGLTTALCAGLIRDEDADTTAGSVQGISVPQTEDLPQHKREEILTPSVNNHEDLAEGQRSFSERLANCVQENFSSRDGMSTVECLMIPLPHTAFPGEDANAQDFPSSYVHKFSNDEPDPMADFSLNKVQCFAYDSQDNPVARTTAYAGPFIERNEEGGWGSYDVHYGQIVGGELGQYGFGNDDRFSMPYPISEGDVVLLADEFEGATDDAALQTLCDSTLDRLSPKRSPYDAQVDVSYLVGKDREFTDVMHALGYELLHEKTDLKTLLTADALLSYLDPQFLYPHQGVGAGSTQFYKPDEMQAIDCTLLFDLASKVSVSCHKGNPLVFTSEGQISEVVEVPQDNSCVTTYHSTLDALMQGGELEGETICD